MRLIINRWQQEFGDRFKIFIYSDLRKDNRQFFIDYCNRMGLDQGPTIVPPPVNLTTYSGSIPIIDDDMQGLLDLEIKKLGKYWYS